MVLLLWEKESMQKAGFYLLYFQSSAGRPQPHDRNWCMAPKELTHRTTKASKHGPKAAPAEALRLIPKSEQNVNRHHLSRQMGLLTNPVGFNYAGAVCQALTPAMRKSVRRGMLVRPAGVTNFARIRDDGR